VCYARQIEVNQDYAGHSGSLFAHASDTVTLHACDWKAGVSEDWPKWMAWHKARAQNASPLLSLLHLISLVAIKSFWNDRYLPRQTSDGLQKHWH
jgi:hypothetical protein